MKKSFAFLISVLVCCQFISGIQAETPFSSERQQQIANMLPPKPAGPGQPATRSEAWLAIAKADYADAILAEARRAMNAEPPVLPDDLFLEFSRNGNRANYERPYSDIQTRLVSLVLAECVEYQGRFLPAIDKYVQAICNLRCWTMPAHDRNLDGFNGKLQIVDLGSSRIGWTLACCEYLLSDKLAPETRRLIHDQVMRRILNPMRDEIEGRLKPQWWFTTTNNWNAVCLANVTGTALTLLDQPQDRAFFVATAEYYIRNFLKGFGADGYCTEGVGYWNYGYGHFIILAETLLQATQGQINLFQSDRARSAALYGRDIFITPSICPAFSDCSIGSCPDTLWRYYLQNRLGVPMGIKQAPAPNRRDLPAFLLFAFDPWPWPTNPAQTSDYQGLPLRTWFESSGILILRPGPEANQTRLAAALKGGNNDEHHNHNDVGSWLLTSNDTLMLADPGSEIYTSRTFSSHRYDSKALNSYGHPVPRVAGQLQKTGSSARGVVLDYQSGPVSETILFNIKSAYNVPSLKTLTRQFTYHRSNPGSFAIQDQAAFSQPEPFETALVTFGSVKKLSGNRLEITVDKETVYVTIESPQPFKLSTETIEENFRTRSKPTRIAITLVDPVIEADITVRVSASN